LEIPLKKLLAVLAIAAAGTLGVAAPAQATQPQATHKIGFCHATGSATNPYVYITTDKIAVIKGHASHQDGRDIIPRFTYEFQGASYLFGGLNTTATSVPTNCSITPYPTPNPNPYPNPYPYSY
jgi:hypothetical protein